MEEREDMPHFLRRRNIAGRMARVTRLPQGRAGLVEMESYVDGEKGQEPLSFHISMEILKQLRNLGLPS